MRQPLIGSPMLDRLLYNAVIAEKYLGSKMRLIVAVVYSFDKDELLRVESYWRRKIEKCPVSIELRFVDRAELNT